MPTTLFGDGALLRDKDGRRFLLEFRPWGEAGIGKEELVLAMAEMARRGRAEPSGAVWLDARDVPVAVLEGYPWLHRFLLTKQIDLTRDLVAVFPAAHTCLGGLVVDVSRAATVGNLFAAGEAAAGVHGAGRLAGGAGTDVLVSGAKAGEAAAASAETWASWSVLTDLYSDSFTENALPHQGPSPQQAKIRRRCQELMGEVAGIWRTAETLRSALAEIHQMFMHVEPTTPVSPASYHVKLADMLLVSGMVVACALRRRESRGAHQRSDYPDTNRTFATSLPLPWPHEAPFVA
jgi:aspartate oxidase